MKCIFCNEEKPPSDEHVFPEALGGKFIVRNVCGDCNSLLGSATDSELNRQIRIYEAYKKAHGATATDQEFRFSKAYAETDFGHKVNAYRYSSNKRIAPTKIGEDEFLFNDTDNKSVISLIESQGKKKSLSREVVINAIKAFEKWALDPKDTFINEVIDIEIKSNYTNTKKYYFMNAKMTCSPKTVPLDMRGFLVF